MLRKMAKKRNTVKAPGGVEHGRRDLQHEATYLEQPQPVFVGGTSLDDASASE